MFVRLVPGAARTLALPCAIGALAVLGVLAAAPAQAHNTLVGTTPTDGAAVGKPPSAVTLTFDQKVLALGTAVRVTGPDGDVQTGKPEVVDGRVNQPVRADAPAGAYAVSWRVTSVDGHPINGDFEYSVTTGRAPEQAASTAASPSPTPTPTNDGGDNGDGDEINWPAVIGWGAAGGLIGAGYVVFQRRRRAGSGS